MVRIFSYAGPDSAGSDQPDLGPSITGRGFLARFTLLVFKPSSRIGPLAGPTREKTGANRASRSSRRTYEQRRSLTVFVLHFHPKSVIFVDGTIEDVVSSDVTRLFDRRFHTASAEAESDFRTRDCGFGRGGRHPSRQFRTAREKAISGAIGERSGGVVDEGGKECKPE